jgi:hypothetical protein
LGDRLSDIHVTFLENIQHWLYNFIPSSFNLDVLFNRLFQIGADLLVGTSILAVFLGILSYFVVRDIAEKHRDRMLKKKTEKIIKITQLKIKKKGNQNKK